MQYGTYFKEKKKKPFPGESARQMPDGQSDTVEGKRVLDPKPDKPKKLVRLLWSSDNVNRSLNLQLRACSKKYWHCLSKLEFRLGI
ncbi:hypothetical protein CDAR_290171 [Caerostris darwini]|uniref:Uncharacterized protein n=1 Tax=Caerostris darwini TaxID=1538125 RepID=A0AAV4SUC9_9ARAC|nr:hypothetical protein CDAR_290171 [Caerostris darwini]